MEITSTNLVLYRKGKEPTKWPLKCVRRYGYDSDLFSFESGRRCHTGSGIYAFRCNRAGSLFRSLQDSLQRRAFLIEDGVIPSSNTVPRIPRDSLINSVGVVSVNSMTPRTVNLVYPNQDETSIDGSYLEPSRQGRFNPTTHLGTFGSDPISPSLASPGSPNSFNNILEVTPLPNTSLCTNHHVSNVYQEFPVTGKKFSLDIPPQELAPQTPDILSDEDLHPYENTSPGSLQAIRTSETQQYINVMVGEAKSPHEVSQTPTTASGVFNLLRSESITDPSRCYENIKPLHAEDRHSKAEIFSKVDLPLKSMDCSEPTTPTSPSSPGGVNYVLLDLNTPVDATAVTEVSNNNDNATTNNNNNVTQQTPRKIANLNFSNSFDSFTNNHSMPASKSLNGLLVESPTKKTSAGYATIDFHKTIALSNTRNSLGSPENCRRTRHS